jgi:hypothetical protein
MNTPSPIPIANDPISPTFRTPDEAIRFAESYPPLAVARADAVRLANTTIVDGYWTNDEFAIAFSNGLFLHVFLDADAVAWKVCDVAPTLRSTPILRIGSPSVVFRWQNARDDVMDRSRLLSSRIGQNFKTLYAMPQGFLIYTHRQQRLWFHSVYRGDTGQRLLDPDFNLL